MSDGSHDNPYACLKVTVKAIPSGSWFACPRCNFDLPLSAWAAAHLREGLVAKRINAEKSAHTKGLQ
jgi:hypothetical protein